ncbi:MAG TPA: hypothetical protein VLJ37_06820 [bacterium]|nr:hypothetical protein [bacterium]
MNEISLTPQERQLRTLMRLWTFLFGAGAVAFLLFGDWILYSGNYFSVEIMKWGLPAMPLPVEKFWLSLTVSMMATITMIAYYIQKDVRANLVLTSFLLVSKLTSTSVMLSAFFWDRPYFNYLMGSVFCDGPIFVLTLIFYRRAVMSLMPACLKKS